MLGGALCFVPRYGVLHVLWMDLTLFSKSNTTEKHLLPIQYWVICIADGSLQYFCIISTSYLFVPRLLGASCLLAFALVAVAFLSLEGENREQGALVPAPLAAQPTDKKCRVIPKGSSTPLKNHHERKTTSFSAARQKSREVRRRKRRYQYAVSTSEIKVRASNRKRQ